MMVQFCYLRLYLGIETVSFCLLIRMARMDMEWNLKKLGYFFSSCNATPENIAKKLLWSVPPDEICLVSSSQLYLNSLRSGEGIQNFLKKQYPRDLAPLTLFNAIFFACSFTEDFSPVRSFYFVSFLTETDRETIEELNVALRNERTRAEQIQQAFTNEKRQTEALKHVKEQADQLRSINKGYLLKAVSRWR